MFFVILVAAVGVGLFLNQRLHSKKHVEDLPDFHDAFDYTPTTSRIIIEQFEEETYWRN